MNQQHCYFGFTVDNNSGADWTTSSPRKYCSNNFKLFTHIHWCLCVDKLRVQYKRYTFQTWKKNKSFSSETDKQLIHSVFNEGTLIKIYCKQKSLLIPNRNKIYGSLKQTKNMFKTKLGLKLYHDMRQWCCSSIGWWAEEEGQVALGSVESSSHSHGVVTHH